MLNKKEVLQGIKLSDLIVKMKFTNSKSESRKLIRGQGVRLNGQTINDELFLIDYEQLSKNNNIISVGKKKHFRVITE